MKNTVIKALVGSLLVVGALQAYGQNYPTAKPKPKPKPSASTSASPSPAPTAGDPTPKPPLGPLKMISTDGTNKNSPIRVVDLQYYDEGYGSKYNSEVRVSGTIQNTEKTAELKKVLVRLQIVDGKGDIIQEWKENPGTLKPGQQYRVNPVVWRNSLGTMLKARFMVEHEEVPKKDGAK